MTLEPRALYLYTPFRDQSELPLFDTGLPDLNLVQLFRTNRYVGADRVNDANQIAFGLTSRLFNADSGAQYLAASIGQVYYFETAARGVARRAAGDARHLRLHRAGVACRRTRTGTSKPGCNGIPKTPAASARSSGCSTGPTASAW